MGLEGMFMRQLFLIAVTVFMLVVPALAENKDERDYQKALATGTVTALENFVQKYPRSALRSQAQQKIAEMELKEAATTGTAAAYRAIAEKYGSTAAGKEAKARAEELGFAEAKQLDTPAAYVQFIQQNPESALVGDALKRGGAAMRPQAEAEAAFFAALENAIHIHGSFPLGSMGAGSSMAIIKNGLATLRVGGPASLEYTGPRNNLKIVKGEYGKGSFFVQGEDLFFYDSTGWWALRPHADAQGQPPQAQPAPPSPQVQAQPAPAPMPAPVPSASKYTLREGTEVKLQFAEDLSSKTAVVGGPVTFVLSEDLKGGGVAVAMAGAKALGTVSNAKKAGMMGKGGELNVRLESLKVGSNQVALRGTKAREGDSKVGTTVALTALFGPIGLITHGKDIDIKRGAPMTAYVAHDIDLPPAQETQAGPAPPPPAPAAAATATPQVMISSVPPDAEIEIDGAFSGTTPSSLSLPSGQHRLTLSKNGFTTWERNLEVRPGAALNVNAELMPNRPPAADPQEH
jgi:hypothetical protein